MLCKARSDPRPVHFCRGWSQEYIWCHVVDAHARATVEHRMLHHGACRHFLGGFLTPRGPNAGVSALAQRPAPDFLRLDLICNPRLTVSAVGHEKHTNFLSSR